MRITIFEGPDGSGKTSAAKWYAEHVGGRYFHWGPVDDPLKQYIDFLAEEIPKGGHLVLDRFFQSERVYGPILRGRDRLGPHARMLERVCLGHEVIVCLCFPGLEIVAENIEQRARGADLENILERVADIYAGYVSAIVGLPWLFFDYNQHSYEILADRLSSRLSRHENLGPGIGWYGPNSYLIVGESPGGTPETATGDWPFVGYKGCSPWLAEQLDLTRKRENNLYWINAQDRDGNLTDPEPLRQMREAYKPWNTFALGKIAEDWCLEAGFGYTYIHHPQYWKRFHHNERYDLVRAFNGEL